MRRRFGFQGFRFYSGALAIALFVSTWAGASARELTRPVWLVSNGFHTSLAFRVGDLPSVRAIAADPRAETVLIGWGAADFYHRKINPWTLVHALCGSPSILHVVPLRGRIERRFAHSDIIELRLPSAQLRKLASGVEQAFTHDEHHRPILVGAGYFAESRFFAGRERFYFPKMCNVWVAQRLRAAGLPIFVPTALTAGELTHQVERLGERRQWRREPVDAF